MPRTGKSEYREIKGPREGKVNKEGQAEGK